MRHLLFLKVSQHEADKGRALLDKVVIQTQQLNEAQEDACIRGPGCQNFARRPLKTADVV